MSDRAFRQYVVKVHSRCNLACDYCYMYEAADQSWIRRPKSMSIDTVTAAGRRIAEHLRGHGLECVHITLHGGEPLLVGLPHLRAVMKAFRETVDGEIQLEVGLQTNGLLLDRPFARFFLEEGIRVGISLDGGPAANDRHRRDPRGRSSYSAVLRAVQLMTSQEFHPVFSGILSTIDLRNDPIELLDDLSALRPGKIDLLLPHATWETPPPAAVPGRTVYGDWLIKFFDAWYAAPPVIGVRLFEEIMHTLLGGASSSEAVGLSAPEHVVIETDGAFERSDALKVAFDGAPSTGFDVFRNSLDDVLQLPAIQKGMSGLAALSAACRSCPIVRACGGGLFAHRYRATNGFDNPSVYCADLGRLINHIGDRLHADLARLKAQTLALDRSPAP
jgi:uncharacterized protein